MTTATITIEIELGWGLVQYDMLDALSEDRKRETETLVQLLSLCDELDLPLTFDVVGHLFLEEPLEDYDGDHPEGWFGDIPQTGLESDPEFYAPDLVQMIRAATVDHELATHTFTHVRSGEVSKETLRWELENVTAVHDEMDGSAPRSFVPPNHSKPPYDVLTDAGIRVVRLPNYHADGISPPATRVHEAGRILSGRDPLVKPAHVDGLVETYVSEHISLASPLLPSGQLPPHPLFQALPKSLRRTLHSRALSTTLQKAREQNIPVHHWAHLWDLSNDQQWPQVEQFLRELAAVETEGAVSVRTMGELEQFVTED
jgi:peptidoglycan/xylan/chitin deacetylase (PgdA/CDA1 family)